MITAEEKQQKMKDEGKTNQTNVCCSEHLGLLVFRDEVCLSHFIYLLHFIAITKEQNIVECLRQSLNL